MKFLDDKGIDVNQAEFYYRKGSNSLKAFKQGVNVLMVFFLSNSKDFKLTDGIYLRLERKEGKK